MRSAAQPGAAVRPRRQALLGWAPVGIAVLGVLIAAFLVLRPSGAPSMVGQAAPGFTVQSVDGTRVSLSALRGHPVVLNFWGVSCIYCRKEMPLLQQAYQQHRTDGLVIMGIDAQGDDASSINAFSAERAVTYPMYLEGNVDWAKLYTVGALPQSVFIDRHGVVRELDQKPFLDAGSLAQSLHTIL
ncbi:MAG TPA: TlpA disulfide reductase family protein [Chloroflexota bacterium]|nr:TlpA disulfide reductase family protein [Chloroflexota bacterium]